MATLAATLATLLATAVLAGASDLTTVALKGEAHTPDATRVATLRLACQPDRGGVLELQLQIADAQTVGDFDFEPFEGPDAPAASRALSAIAVDGDGGRHEMRHAAAGWYSADDSSAFVLGVSERSRHVGDLAKLVARIDQHTQRITWMQHGHSRGEQTIEATFTVDANQGRHLRGAAAPCLPRPQR